MAAYRRHVAGATIFFALYLAGLGALYSAGRAYAQFSPAEVVAYTLVLFGICLLFGLWPDVDTSSVSQELFYTIFLVVDAVLIFTHHFEAAAYFGLLAILPIVSKHRGWTHSWWATLLVPAPLLVVPALFFEERRFVGLPFYGAAVVGYVSHLVMDGLLLRRRRGRRALRK